MFIYVEQAGPYLICQKHLAWHADNLRRRAHVAENMKSACGTCARSKHWSRKKSLRRVAAGKWEVMRL